MQYIVIGKLPNSSWRCLCSWLCCLFVVFLCLSVCLTCVGSAATLFISLFDMDGECCFSVCLAWMGSAAAVLLLFLCLPVSQGWGVLLLFISLFDTNGECFVFVISLFIGLCDTGHVWGSTAAIHLLFLFSVWLTWVGNATSCHVFSVFSLIDTGGECYILSCVFCFQSDWHGWGMLHPVMCFLFSVWLTRVGNATSCYVFSVFSLIDMDGEYYILSCVVSVFSLIDTDGVYYILSCVFCFQSDWHGWGILHLVMCCFCFSVCLTWVGSTTVMLQTSPAPFHAMGNLQRNSAKSMKQFTMPVELSWMHANQVGVVGKGEGKK